MYYFSVLTNIFAMKRIVDPLMCLFVGIVFTVIIFIIVSMRDVPAKTLAYYIISAVLWAAYGIACYIDADRLIAEAGSDFNKPLTSLSNDHI